MEDIQDASEIDSVYKYDRDEQKKILAEKPWISKYPSLTFLDLL
jgi:hypothetical protein